MFQFAAGRALSIKLDTYLLLDTEGFKNYTLHQGFEIERIFMAKIKRASRTDVTDLLGWRSQNLAQRFLRKLNSPFISGDKLVIEPHFNYWPGFNDITDSVYLMGYWQSFKYFQEYESELRDDFQYRMPLDERNNQFSKVILGCNSVGLHIRRGDYLSDKKTAKVLNLCSLNYYLISINYLAERLDNPTFFIFSDDLQWARENLKIPFRTIFVGGNHSKDSYIDMQLMSMCNHQIIANSSFSWWGAWLNKNDNKIVVAPKVWFRNGINDSDLIPEKWVRL